MINILYCSPEGQFRSDLSLEQVAEILASGVGVLWVDFESTPAETDEPILRQMFGFHPLAIDDALQETHVPKVDDWDEYLYIVMTVVKILPDHPSEVKLQELDVFLGKQYIVTHHDEPIDAVGRAMQAVQRDERYSKNGADRFLYRLVDDVVASYMPVVDQLDLAIDKAEDEIFSKATPEVLENVFTLKRTTLQLRRVIGPRARGFKQTGSG